MHSAPRTDLNGDQLRCAILSPFQKIQQQIDGMRKDIEQLEIITQRCTTGRVVPQRAEREIALDVSQVPESGQQLEGSARRWLVQKLVAGTNLETLAVRELRQMDGGSPCFDKWLLDVDVEAGLECLSCQRFVRVGRRTHV